MTQPEDAEERPVECICVKDPFAALPPELRPRPNEEQQPAQGDLSWLRAGVLDESGDGFVYGV